MNIFENRLAELEQKHRQLIERPNKSSWSNGVWTRYVNPVLTEGHIPLFWRYDLNPLSNPHLLERIGFGCTFNAGAILWKGRYLMVVRVEGSDRKSFFAIAESPNGIDHFQFWERPITLPEIEGNPDTNVYDMRLTAHEDGWIYGIFCTERKDPTAPAIDTSAAVAAAGIVRTRDFVHWERLPDLQSESHQRNVVLHPEFVDGKYALYTRPQDGFIDTGSGGGIGWALIDDITHPSIDTQKIIEPRIYHTVKESKNGEGPQPIKTPAGWLHLAHGVRYCAAGLRYVLYMYLTALDNPSKVIASPAGYTLAPWGDERVGDVSNVLFSNGWIVDKKNNVYLYYASSDTRLHVATSTIDILMDYCLNTPPDGLRSAESVKRINQLIDSNLAYLKKRNQ